ncbi:MAG: sulfotransferase domain-containing protein [archaeon]
MILLPNFICPGAQKAATTSLYNILKLHPDVFLPDIKEPQFFAVDKKYKNGLEWYEKKYYSNVSEEKIIGDISTGYMAIEHSAERIANDLGTNIKIIFLLRNPVDRAYSHYWMEKNKYFEVESFERALELEEERKKK